MERPATPASLTRVQRGDRRTPAVVAIVGVALVVAVAKPWPHATGSLLTSAGSPADSHADSAASAATAAPQLAPDGQRDRVGEPPMLLLAGRHDGIVALPGGRSLDCFDPPGWRLVLDGAVGGQLVRTWIAVQPVPAAGPADPGTPAVRIVGGPVIAIGFCAPAVGALGQPQDWLASVWRVAHGSHGVEAALVAVTEPSSGAVGGLARSVDLAGSPAAWAAGRYAIGFRSRRAGAAEAWLVVDVVSADSAGSSGSGA